MDSTCTHAIQGVSEKIETPCSVDVEIYDSISVCVVCLLRVVAFVPNNTSEVY